MRDIYCMETSRKNLIVHQQLILFVNDCLTNLGYTNLHEVIFLYFFHYNRNNN